MAFLNGIFGNNGNQQRQQNSQQQQPQPQQQNNQQQGPQGQNPQQQVQNGNGSAGPAGGQQQQPANSQVQGGGNPANPLDPFWKLMQPDQQAQQYQQQLQEAQTAPLFGSMKPEDISAQVKKTNFTSSIDPQKAQKALAGDQGAFMEVINEAVQGAFQASLQMTQGMVEHGVKTGNDRFSSTLDSRFRNFQLNSQNSKNPALQHPLGQALLKTVKQQIATANPRLSPEEVHAQGEEMFGQFAKMLMPQDQGQAEGGKSGAQAMDWTAFLEGPNEGQGGQFQQ